MNEIVDNAGNDAGAEGVQGEGEAFDGTPGGDHVSAEARIEYETLRSRLASGDYTAADRVRFKALATHVAHGGEHPDAALSLTEADPRAPYDPERADIIKSGWAKPAAFDDYYAGIVDGLSPEQAEVFELDSVGYFQGIAHDLGLQRGAAKDAFKQIASACAGGPLTSEQLAQKRASTEAALTQAWGGPEAFAENLARIDAVYARLDAATRAELEDSALFRSGAHLEPLLWTALLRASYAVG